MTFLQAVSSIFYAWGRLDGYLPSAMVLQLMWEPTLQLALNFDTQVRLAQQPFLNIMCGCLLSLKRGCPTLQTDYTDQSSGAYLVVYHARPPHTV